MGNHSRWFWVGVAIYLAVVAVTAAITGPTVIPGADGLEIGPLLLLGFPCSVPLTFVGSWGMLGFGQTAAHWGALIGLITGSVANVVIAYTSTGRSAHPTRTS